MSGLGAVVVLLLLPLLGCLALYVVIRLAVKHGITDAHGERDAHQVCRRVDLSLARSRAVDQ
jgi:hypothetical protein